MKRIVNRGLAVLLSVMMLAGLIPMGMNVAAEEETYGWKVKQFCSTNEVNIPEGAMEFSENGFRETHTPFYKQDTSSIVIYNENAPLLENSVWEFDLRYQDAAEKTRIGFYPRFQDGNNCGGIAFDYYNQLQQAGCYSGGEYWSPEIPNSTGFALQHNTDYHFKFITTSEGIKMYIDGNLIAERTDISTLPETGRYGIRIWGIADAEEGNKYVDVKNVEFYEYSESGIDNDSVTVSEENWGKEDVKIPFTLSDGDSVTEIKNGDAVLSSETDYTIEDGNIIIKKEYVKQQADSFNLYVRFSSGVEDSISVNILQALPQPLHYYKFDERSGDTFADSSGNENAADGTKNGTVTSVVGRNGRAIKLSGDGCVDVTSRAFKETDTYTISAWINWDGSLPATNTIFNGHELWLHVRNQSGNNRKLWANIWHNNTGVDLGPESKEVTANVWTHVAFVYDNGNISLYKDGELMGSREGAISSGTDMFSIGGNGNNGGLHPFHGMIDEVKIFSEPLSSAQIGELAAQPEDVRSTLGKDSMQFLPEDWGKNDVEIPVTFGEGDSLKNIVDAESGEELGESDYSVNENSITIKKEYIANKEDSFTLYFYFVKGSEAEFTATKLDMTYREYTWTPDKGIDEWKKLNGSGSIEMMVDGSGMLVTGEVAMLNMAAPQLTDGEIEITFDQKTDDSYVGFLFRSDEDMTSWQAVREETYGKWRYTDSNGTRKGVYGDGSSTYSRDGEAYTKLKVRFENGVISLWMDDQFMGINTVEQAVSEKGYVGLYTQSTTNMVVKEVTFRSSIPFLAQQDETGDKVISDGDMSVTLADNFPRVKEYTLNGKTMYGSEFKHDYVTINSVNIPAVAEVTNETDNSITYTVTPERGAAESFDVVYTVMNGNTLEIRFNNIIEKDGELVYSINLPNQPIISANSNQSGAKVDATTFYPCLQGEDGDWDQTTLTDEHFTVAENKIRKNADLMATLAFVTTDELSAAITNNVLYNVRELRYRAFDLPDGSISAGVWNSEFAYRGLDGEKLLPLPTEPDDNDLYCRVILTEDTNDDQQPDWQDGANALKTLVGDKIPGGGEAARSFFEVGYNFASGAQQPFIKVGDNLKRMSNLIDGFSQILIFKGYANEGHDSGHSDYDDINKRAGGVEDLNAMTEAIEDINSIFGIHINHSECYPEAKMFSDHTMSTENGWAWMDQSKGLRREVDILNSEDGSRSMDERLDSMFELCPGIDFVYVDTYGDDRWAETRLATALTRNGAMIGTENKIDFDRYASWVHWPGIGSDSMHHFVYHTQKDIYTGNSMYWGGYSRSSSFMSWQHNNNINSVLGQFYTNQLPQKYLMCHEVIRQTDDTAYFEGNVTSSNYVITKDGKKLTDGAGKIFIPWYDEDTSVDRNPDEAAKIYHWNSNGGKTTWDLPDSWSDVTTVYLYRTTQDGKTDEKAIKVENGQVTLDVEAKTPYVLYKEPQEADVTEWSVGSELKDTGFNSRDFSIWQNSGDADIYYEDDGNGVSILNIKGSEEGQVSQTMEGLVPGQKYRVVVHAGAENGKTARLTVDTGTNTYENYLDKVGMTNQYFDSYVKGKNMQRMWVDFVAESDTATVTLSGDACESADGKTTFMETRIVKTAEPDLPEGYVANETFEYVEQGAYGIFNPERSADGVPHLSETHRPYTNDTITGDWSLKLYGHYGQGDVTVRTSPATMRLEPNTTYTVEFDTLGNGKVYIQSEADGNDKVLEESYSAGHHKYTFTTGDKNDYIARIERSSVLDNFKVYLTDEVTEVTGIDIENKEIEMSVGDTLTLNPTIQPVEANNKQVVWNTDENDIVSVDQTGKLVAVAKGTTTITGTTVEGGYTVTVTVTVTDKEYVKGDVNHDGTLNIDDATLIQQFLVELNPDNFDQTLADMNDDGVINIIDATLIQLAIKA